MRANTKILGLASLVLAGALITGCGSGDGSDVSAGALVKKTNYEVTVTNLTNNQPLSTIAILVHAQGYSAWNVGEAASSSLEKLAEGGDNKSFIKEAKKEPLVVDTESGKGVIPPGGSETVKIKGLNLSTARLTAATMLVNTNDAFTGVNGADISGLAEGESVTFKAQVYDAGTEADTESGLTVPGPAGGGEGYNPVRDDAGFVATHTGVVTRDEGLASSVLDESHRFIGPGALITVTRTK